MNKEATKHLKKALARPAAEQAELADSLFASLDTTENGSVAAAWDAEIARRLEDLEAGKIKAVSAHQAHRRLLSVLA